MLFRSGLRAYMPTTFYLMWIATLAIAGIPPLAGFFSKDEILGAVFERAGHSTIASAHLFGIPGSAWLYLSWVLGLAAAWVATRSLSALLFGVTAHDPLTFIGAAVIVTFVAIAASFVPAYRATAIPLTEALRAG